MKMSIERIYSYYLYTKVPITQRPLARTSINSGFFFYLVTTLAGWGWGVRKRLGQHLQVNKEVCMQQALASSVLLAFHTAYCCDFAGGRTERSRGNCVQRQQSAIRAEQPGGRSL